MTLIPTERFLRHFTLRAPQRHVKPAKAAQSHFIGAPGDFQSLLVTVVENKNATTPRDVHRVAAEIFAEIGPVGKDADAMLTGLRAVVQSAGRENTADSFAHSFDQSAQDLVRTSAFRKIHNRAWDAYYCLAANAALPASERERHADVLKAIHAIETLADDEYSNGLIDLSQVFRKKLLVPAILFPPLIASEKAASGSKSDEAYIKQIDALLEKGHLIRSIEQKVELFDAIYYAQDLPSAKVIKEQVQGADAANDAMTAVGLELPKKDNWLLKALARDAPSSDRKDFTPEEITLLRSVYADLLHAQEPEAPAILEQKFYHETKSLIRSMSKSASTKARSYSGLQVLVQIAKIPEYEVELVVVPLDAELILPDFSLPRVHQLGIGDLFVLEQQVNRYELGEVAHIENVMAKETRQRHHKRTNETEIIQTTEDEETISDEKSLQTTSRFEISDETEKQTQQSFEASAGFSVSATYGAVTATANGDIATSNSTNEAQATAKSFARDVVEKSVSEITSRVREEKIRRSLIQIEETNSHGFINDTAQHLSGIYRWVDKYFTVRNVNYGRRLMLEMIIPEPAAEYLSAEIMNPEHAAIAPPPPEMNFTPEDISRSNYRDHVKTYGATDVKAPPPKVIFKTINIANPGNGEPTFFADVKDTLTIDKGYIVSGLWGRKKKIPSRGVTGSGALIIDNTPLTVFVGNDLLGDGQLDLNSVTGNLSVSALGEGMAFMAGIQVRCSLTSSAFQDWQLETWSALKAAHTAAVSEYEAKIAAATIGTGIHIHGRNPGQNAEIIRTELKRSAIRLISDDMKEIFVKGFVRRNEVFDATTSDGSFDLHESKVEGAISQFFEQAFEWENMAWKFYSYFWARNSERHHKLLAEDVDPVFREFRRAGAARVVVPVPIAYQDAVLHFFATNEIWQGGDTPVLDDPEYIALVDDLRRGQINSYNSPIYYQGEDSEPPFIVDEWEIKLPTSLVKLQLGDDLPVFSHRLAETDPTRLLDALADADGSGKDWRGSVVGLLELLSFESDEASRRSLAADKGYPGNASTDVIANINQWLHEVILRDISTNGLP